ncbi:MAG: hypothetical protein ACKVG7_07030 [Flavobacteriales bacterium]
MGNLEKPLTWGLTILLLGYLFVANCKCGEESTCQLNNGFNISNTDINVDMLKVDATETVDKDGEMVEAIQESLGLTDSEMAMFMDEADSTDELYIAIEGAGGMAEEIEEIEEE